MVFAALVALFCAMALLPAIKMLSANLLCLQECQAVWSVLAAASSAFCCSWIALCLFSFLCSSSGQYKDLALGRRVKKASRSKQDQMGWFSSLSINWDHLYALKCACSVTTARSCLLFCSIAFSAYTQHKEIPNCAFKNKSVLCFVTTRLFKYRKYKQLYW